MMYYCTNCDDEIGCENIYFFNGCVYCPGCYEKLLVRNSKYVRGVK